ncbi:MAG: acyl-CoA reductase [Bacteroidetes bacterium]|nr:acyl-CoA reductase [Bacteroidota bacterium]
MNFEQRIDFLYAMGQYLLRDSPSYQTARNKAYALNKWFLPEFVFQAGSAIAHRMLQPAELIHAAEEYAIHGERRQRKTVGIVMAGNIPWVGLQDLICVFLSGHKAIIKPSSKDGDLIRHLISVLQHEHPPATEYFAFEERLTGCDAFLATGSDNTARHFEYYFRNHPHLIRKNRTSIALLEGDETADELSALADDIQLYFGLGCRNVTQVIVPLGYDFQPLLLALKKYDYYKDHDKYRNNYDFRLTLAILNKQYYMSNDSILLIEDANPFSPISQLNYRFYADKNRISEMMDANTIQCCVGRGHLPFGVSQSPHLRDFPDGLDILRFLSQLSETG